MARPHSLSGHRYLLPALGGARDGSLLTLSGLRASMNALLRRTRLGALPQYVLVAYTEHALVYLAGEKKHGIEFPHDAERGVLSVVDAKNPPNHHIRS